MVNSQRKKIAKIIISVTVIVLLLIIFNFFNSAVRNFFYTISNPIQKILYQKSQVISNFFSSSLRKEVLELQLQNQNLLNQLLLLEELKKENRDLHQALDLGIQNDFKIILAKVIAKDVYQNSILIDKGYEDGVSENMAVIDSQKILFGKISEVYKNFSKVVLLTEKNFSFDAKVMKKDIHGIVKGTGGYYLIFDLIPFNEKIEKDDIITTSYLSGVFPKNLLVGRISVIRKEDIKSFQMAEIKPFFELRRAENLFVITNFKK